LKWAVEGDENSRFYHSSLKRKLAANTINGINVNGTWCIIPYSIKAAADDHFGSRFREHDHTCPMFVSSLYRKLSVADAMFLKSRFTMDEVKSAIWNCEGSKAPCPDGLNFNFVKAYWDIVKDDFFDCIKYVYPELQ
ncbi:hypothetical protein Tco_1008197, partial [Tanacetum coccineum]